MKIGMALVALLAVSVAGAQGASTTDPRASLKPGFMTAGDASKGMDLVAHHGKPMGFGNPDTVGDFKFADADLAFRGSLVFQGGYHGFQVWDVSNPRNPTL